MTSARLTLTLTLMLAASLASALSACSTADSVPVNSPESSQIDLPTLSSPATAVDTRTITRPGDSAHGAGAVVISDVTQPRRPAEAAPTPTDLAAAALAAITGQPAPPAASPPTPPAPAPADAPQAAASTPAEPVPTSPVPTPPASAAPEPAQAAAPAASANAEPATPPQPATPPPPARTWTPATPLSIPDAPTPPARTAAQEQAQAPATPSAPEPAAAATAGFVTLFPGVRVDRAARLVEFDGIVPIDAHDPGAPNVYLELVACTPDTREHESLVMTRAKAAHVHAALLLLGLEPGTPGRIDFEGQRPRAIAPTGPRLAIELRHDADGRTITRAIEDLIINAKTGATLPRQTWRFTGSRFAMRKDAAGTMIEAYDAEGMGTLIGLATFGSETIAPETVFSPDSAQSEPVWIADRRTLPKISTPVTIRLRALDAPNAQPAMPATPPATPTPAPARRFDPVPR